MPKNDDAGSASVAVPTIEHKRLDIEIKAMGEEGPGSATLYVAIFSNRDRVGDVIVPGAFKNLNAFTRDGFYAISHNWGILPIGTVTSAKQDARGLLVDVAFHSTEDAQACRTVMRERMERGKSVQSSIGYVVTEDEVTIEDGVTTRYLKGVELFEASFVNVACNPETDAVNVKGLATVTNESKAVTGKVETKYYDDYAYGYYGYDDDPNNNAATAAICALMSGLMRSIARSLCDDETPKAERLANLTKAFSDVASTSIKLLDVLMEDESASEMAAKSFGSLVIATKGAVIGRARVEAKAGRVLSKATIEKVKAHLDTIDEHMKSAGDSHAGTAEACKGLRDYIDTCSATSDTESTADGKGAASASGSFAERSERLASDLDGVLATFKHQSDTRESEGRTLSPAKWDVLARLAEKAAALAAKRPNPDAATKDADTGEAAPAPADDATVADPNWGDIYRLYADTSELVDTTLSGS